MNRCTLLDEILQAHVPRQPPEPYWCSRSQVKGQGHMAFLCFFMCVTLQLPVVVDDHVGCVKVAAVVGRADLMSALCFMSAFISYVCAVHSGSSAQSRRF